ncbi:MAG TPA: fibronectin type III domain-containing protein, partial [Gemmatimonadaceae bacterium]
GTNFNPSFQCVAVSKTGNPAGAYWLYDSAYAGLNDYGQFAVCPDAYYATFNLFNPSFAGPILCAYDRTSMLAGSPATQQCFQQSNSFNGVLPASLDGPIRPPRGEPAFFMNLGTNALKLWELHVDWTTPANSMLSGPTTLSVTPFTQPCSGSCVPQQSPGNLLISLSDRLMPRLTYRNFGTHESIVVNHTVTSGATSGIRWYEIRSPNGTPVVFQQGTFAPADGKWRWMGSIAQDQAQGFAAGYSLSATTMAPAIAWAGRMAGDAAGTFGQAESVVQSGSGVETGNNFNGTIASSWGYYSSMTVDPVDDCTFWYTAELYGTNGIKTWDTRVASVKFPNCAANDFSISIAPPAQTVLPGGQVAYTVSTGSIAGTPETIILNVQDLPAGVSASFAPSTVTAGSTSTLTLTATAAAPFVAPAPFTVIGKAPSAVHATSAQVGVTPAAPANLIATVNSAGSVDVSWTPAAGAATYELYRKVEGTSLSSYATGLMTNSFTDTSVTADTAYLYKVNAVNAGVSSLDSNIDLATTTIYNDEPLVAGSSVVQGDPLTKMRTAVNAVRALAGRLPASFTDVPPAGAPIRSMHVTELRSALDDARSHLFLSSLTYSNTAAPGTPIRTIDVTEIRDGMK